MAAVAALAPAAAYGQMEHDHAADMATEVSMGYSTYSPVHVDVLTGDTVQWSNASARSHTVTADDGSFDSDRVVVSDGYSHEFAAPGAYPYHCRLHPVMRGEVDVHTLLLDPQPEPAAAGRPIALGGRSALPAGAEVTIEADAGGGYRSVATTTVGEGGGFSAGVTPSASTTYRAVHDGEASPPVEVLVLDRHVTARAARHGLAVVVSAHVSPDSHGQMVVLQLRSRERFGWWPERRARLDHHSSARFVIHTSRRVTARVALTRNDAATRLAESAVLRLPAARR